MSRTEIATKPVIDFEDQYVTATVPLNSGNGTTVATFKLISFRLKMGCAAFIRALGNAAAAAGQGALKFRLKVNGSPIFPYDGSLNQWGDPALLQDLPRRIPVPQGALIEVEVDNSDGANAFAGTARVFVDYENF